MLEGWGGKLWQHTGCQKGIDDFVVLETLVLGGGYCECVSRYDMNAEAAGLEGRVIQLHYEGLTAMLLIVSLLKIAILIFCKIQFHRFSHVQGRAGSVKSEF